MARLGKRNVGFYWDLLADAKKFTYLRAANIGRLAANVLRTDELQEKTVLGEKLLELVVQLEEKQAKVILIRYGLCEEFPTSTVLEKVGEALDISKQRAAEIEKNALKNLRADEWSSKETFYIPFLEKRKLRDENKEIELDEKQQKLLAKAISKGIEVSAADWNTVKDLELSTRAHTTLEKCGVVTILDFKLLSITKLYRTRWAGEKTYAEIAAKRDELGVPFKEWQPDA